MWFAIPFIALIAVALYEYRLRRPDQLILFESKGAIGFRKARWYPRHFSLALPGTTHLMELRIEASAKGNIPIVVKMAATVAAAKENIAALIRVGGWSLSAVNKAAKELETVLHGLVKERTEKFELEGLSSEGLREYLVQRAGISRENFGLDILSLIVQSLDPVDQSIAEALRQRETARILEKTESMNQNARVAAAQAKIQADEQIGRAEHELGLRKFDQKKVEQEREAQLAQNRVEDEMKRNRMRLEFDREEMNLVKENPQLLLLTPQAARLAEASQSLRNAKTVVSLSPGDAEQGAKLLGLFQLFLENIVNAPPKQAGKKSKES
jgi:hypothetical protein